MADIQSNIDIRIDTSSALSSIKLLQAQMSAFHTSMAKGTAATAAASQQLQQKLIDSVNATQKFSAGIQTIKTTTESFTTALEKNKLSLGQYFRYSIAATKSFGGAFKTEMSTIDKVARERVKDLQTQYIQLGRDANGAMKSIAIRPLVLDLESMQTKTALAAQKQQILNQLLKQGSTNLLNFGKNTQWAGRQLMVGFTIPLSMAATAAAKAYMDIEKAAIQISRVYGDLNTSAADTANMVDQIKNLAAEYTKYGIAVSDTMAMAAKAAAMGKTGADLLQQVNEATKLSALGGVDQNTALDTTISLTNAFGISADKLSTKINYLNAVENQTVLSIEDMTIAIPKAAPVVQQLGGSVEDLAVFLTAMKEGGINASEGANALKSGLSALINPSKKASEFLMGFGVNVKGIVEQDKGNLRKTVVDFAKALDQIDPLNRARAIEMMFGKFQFARISTLLQNVTKDGSQASRALELANMSSIQLAAISRKELDKLQSSPMYKFQKSIADLQLKIAPIGETFLKAVTPIIEKVGDFLGGFNKMGDGFKQFVVVGAAVLGGLAPVLLMVVGLVANGAANIIKMFANVKAFLNKTTSQSQVLGETTNYLTTEQIKAEAVAASLDQTHSKLKQTFTSETSAVMALMEAYQRANAEMSKFRVPGMPTNIVPRKKMAAGGVVQGPGGPTDDAVPANLSNGEVVLSVDTVNQNPAVVGALLSGKKVNIPGYATQGIVGRAALGRGRSRQNPNGAELSHFNSDSWNPMATGRKILEQAAAEGEASLASWTRLLTKQAKDLGLSFEEILDKEFKVYNNKIVLMSSQLNNLLKPSSGGTTAGVVKQEFLLRGQETHGYVALQLQKMGVAKEEIAQIINELTTTVNNELGQLSNETQMTEAKLSEVLDKSYQNVAKVRPKLQAVLEDMEKMAYVDSLVKGKSGSGGTRLLGREQGTSNYRGSGAQALALGASLRPDETATFSEVTKRSYPFQAHIEIYDKLIQTNSAQLQKINEIEDRLVAERELELLAIKEGITTEEKLTEAKNRQLLAITGSTVTTQSGSAMSAVNSVASGLESSAQIQSPSKRLEQDGRNLFLGLHGGLMASLPKMRVAGAAFGQAAIKPMTAITPAMRQYLTEWGGKVVAPYIAAHNAAIPVLKAETQAKIQDTAATEADTAAILEHAVAEEVDAGATGGKAGRGGAGKIAAIGIAASMAAGALSMIPGPVGQFVGSMMPVIGIVSGLGMVMSAFNVTMGITTLESGALALAFGALELPLWPLIAGIAALAAIIGVGTLLINASNDARKKELEKINASSDAHKTFAKTVESLAGLAGVGTKPAISASQVSKISATGASGKQISDIDTLLNSTEFTNKDGQTYKDIQKIKRMDNASAKSYISSIGQTLLGQGVKPEDVDSIIKAIQIAAGKKNLNLSFKSIDLTDPKNLTNFSKSMDAFNEKIKNNKNYSIQITVDDTGTQGIVEDSKKKMAYLDAIGSKVSMAKEGFAALQDQYTKGIISSKQYAASTAAITKSFANMDAVSKKIAIDKMFEKADPGIKKLASGITKASDATLLLQASSVMTADAIKAAYGPIPATLDAITNPLIRAAAIQAYQMQRLKTSLKEYLKQVKLDMKSIGDSTSTTTTGTGTNPLKDAQKLLKDLQDANANNQITIGYLANGMNVNLAKALGGMDAAVRKQFIDSKGNLSALGKQLKDAYNAKPLIDFKLAQQSIIQQGKDDILVKDALTKSGYAYSEVMKVMANAELKAAIASTLNNKKILDKKAAIQELINLYNTALETQTTNDPNKADQNIIDAEQKKIDKIQAQTNLYQDALSKLKMDEQDINDKYDKRVAALDAIQAANEKISEQQKGQLDLADALSRGDIAAAARSAQDIRQKAQQDSFATQKKQIDLARQAEINALTISIGSERLTIAELTKRIAANERAVLDSKINVIDPAQQRIADRNSEIPVTDNKINSPTVNIQPNSLGSMFTADQQTVLADLVPPSILNAKPGDSTAGGSILSQIATAIGNKYAPVVKAFTNIQTKSYGGMIKKFVSGGFAVGTDTVPAMLTPGEFVVSKSATENFGVDRLRAINNGTSVGDSVYNYNLSVNMSGSDMNPNDVANVVIAKIRQINSQQLQGNRL